MTVDSAECMRIGWPKCHGETMTIDSPEERRRRGKMADIKQAAKEGKKIRRSIWNRTGGGPVYIVADQDGVMREDTGCRFAFYRSDLLAEDWEIAE
jgi:hypothetical protein